MFRWPQILHTLHKPPVQLTERVAINIPIAVLSMEGASITIPRVNRLQMGAYLCIASNGVPPTVSKRVMLIVHCTFRLDWPGCIPFALLTIFFLRFV